MKFLRYLGVQVVAYGLDMGCFALLLYYAWAGAIVSNIAAKAVAGGFAYFAHRGFTFAIQSHEKHGAQPLKYLLLLAFNIPLSTGVLSGLMLFVPNPLVAKFCSDVLCVALTYGLSKRYVFVSSSRDGSTGKP